MAALGISAGIRRVLGAGALGILTLGGGAAYAAEGACMDEIEPVEEIQVVQANSSWRLANVAAILGAAEFSCGKIYMGSMLMQLAETLSFLGAEPLPAGSGPLALGVVKPDNKVRGVKAGAEFEFAPAATWDAVRRVGMIVRASIEHANGRSHQDLGSFDPGPSTGLAIPGPLGGPSGAFLTGNPLNIVDNMAFALEMASTSATLDFERHRNFGTGSFGVYMGLMMNLAVADMVFEATIPGFTSAFRYDTEIRSKSAGVHIGARGQRNIGQPLSGGWQPVVTARAQAGMAHTSAEMTDALTYSGFLTGFVPNSKRSEKKEDWAPYYEAGFSLSLNKESTWQQFFIDVEWERQPFFGVAQRDGTNPTRLKMSNADVSSVTMGFRWRF